MNSPVDKNLEILAAMRQGVTYRFAVPVRGYNFMLRPITSGEQMRINNEVMAEINKMPEAQRNRITENFLLAIRVLKAASKADPNTTVEGELQESLLQQMTVDEVLMIYDEWLRGCEKVNPRVEEMTAEQLQLMIDSVKKSPSQLTECSFWQLKNLARFLLGTS